MRETQLKLKDKTVVIGGPLNSITQALSTVLTEFGANVAFVTDEYNKVLKFTDNVNISREANPSNGKAIAIEGTIDSKESVSEIFSKVAEFYGTIDAIIDGFLLDSERFSQNNANEIFKSLVNPMQFLLQGGMPYLTGRNKGRYIILNYQTPSFSTDIDKLNNDIHENLMQLKSNVATDIAGSMVTLNCLNLGPTEEYLLKTYPDAASVKDSLSKLQETYDKAKIVEATDVANAVAFFISPLSSAINNICLELDYGIDYRK